MADKLDEFLRDSRRLVRREATDVPQGAEVADWLTIRRFCAALGDPNPLYKDPASGVATKYNSMIAPPTFVAAIRTPTSGAAYDDKDYGASKLLSRATMEWTDVIRVGDRLASELRVTGVSQGHPRNGRRTAEVVSQATYWNSYGGLIGTSTGTTAVISFRRGEEMLLDRDIYRYSEEEVRGIESDIEGEPPPRGQLLRYWDEVSIGEKLPTLVKGPLTLSDMMAWVVGEAKSLALGSPVYFDLKTRPGRVRTNPTTNWPFWDADQEFEDVLSCKDMGFNSPPSRGMQRVCLAGQVLTHWMGDDAFLRRLDIELPNHFLYGDTMWLSGQVTDKYKERVGGAIYHAVDVEVRGTNQLGESVARGSATVYFPSPGHPVDIPIPH